MKNESLISLDRVSKSYAKGRLEIAALKSVSFEVGVGEFLVLMGPSGSGKSTLLNLLAGLTNVDEGILRIGNTDLSRLDAAQRTKWRGANVGLVFQRYHLISVLTAQQNVELPLLLRRMSNAERKTRIQTALRLVDMENRANHFSSELSGGQEQRIAIARALVSDAPLLLCDEPTGNLDVEAGDEILQILRALSAEFGKTIVMVTHDTNAAAMGDRILYLKDGKIADSKTQTASMPLTS